MDINENNFKEFIGTILACIVVLPFFIIGFIIEKIFKIFKNKRKENKNGK